MSTNLVLPVSRYFVCVASFCSFCDLYSSHFVSFFPHNMCVTLNSTLELVLSHRNDFLRRRKYYISDWTDAFKKKRLVIPAVLFLYFACLAPAVSFGTIASEITNGSMGVVEFLLGSGIAGMVSYFV